MIEGAQEKKGAEAQRLNQEPRGPEQEPQGSPKKGTWQRKKNGAAFKIDENKSESEIGKEGAGKTHRLPAAWVGSNPKTKKR